MYGHINIILPRKFSNIFRWCPIWKPISRENLKMHVVFQKCLSWSWWKIHVTDSRHLLWIISNTIFYADNCLPSISAHGDTLTSIRASNDKLLNGVIKLLVLAYFMMSIIIIDKHSANAWSRPHTDTSCL